MIDRRIHLRPSASVEDISPVLEKNLAIFIDKDGNFSLFSPAIGCVINHDERLFEIKAEVMVKIYKEKVA